MMIAKKCNQIPPLAGDTQRPPGEIESAFQPSEAGRHQLRKEQICRGEENLGHLVNAGGNDNDNGKQHRQGGGQRANNNSGNIGGGRRRGRKKRKETKYCFPVQKQHP